MREIKFRGKAIPCNEWVYGSYAALKNDTNTITRHVIMDRSDKENHYIKDGKSYHMSLSVVDETTIGQFSGLHDKNGKEIYEGDIVKWIDEKYMMGKNILCYVDWHRYLCKFYLNFGEEQKVNDSKADIFELMRMGYKYEVVGNIYDNPELLKGGKYEN